MPLVYKLTPALIAHRPTTPTQEVYATLDYEMPEMPKEKLVWHKEQAERVGVDRFKVSHSILPLSMSGEPTLSAYATNDQETRRVRIADIDAYNGEFETLEGIREDERVYVEYATNERYHVYHGYVSDAGHVGADLNPSKGHIRDVWVDGLKPLVTIDAEGALTERASIEWIAQDMYLYIRPQRISIGANVVEQNTVTVMHTTEKGLFEEGSHRYNPFLVPLAKIEVDPPNKADVQVIDGRRLGGGLHERITNEEIAMRDPEALGWWDIGEPMLHDDAGAIVIELDEELLNTFSEAEVEEMVHRRMAFGVLPIIRYVKKQPIDTSEGELMNPEFENGLHVDHYDAIRSSGTRTIEYVPEGTGDDWVLKLESNAKYVVSIPRASLKGKRYEVQVKARLVGSKARQVFKVENLLGTGGVIEKNSSSTNSNDWMVFSQTIDFGMEDKTLRIKLNPNDHAETTTLVIDYVRLIQKVAYDEVERVSP